MIEGNGDDADEDEEEDFPVVDIGELLEDMDNLNIEEEVQVDNQDDLMEEDE